MIKETESKTIIHKHDNAFPLLRDVNIYRGCTIGCKYCFAQYSHFYLGLDSFFKDILVKTNAPEVLDFELNKNRDKEQLKFGGITDSYQHIEKKYLLMPKILKVLAKYKVPIFISTKSDLILRDFDLIKELSEVTSVDIAISISGYNKERSKLFEPGAPSPQKRMETLGKFTKICRTTSVLNIPIIPYLSDSDVELKMIFEQTKKLGIDNLVQFPLHLRNGKIKAKDDFLNFTKKHFPEEGKMLFDLYNSPQKLKDYKALLNTRIMNFRKEFDLFGDYNPLPKKKEPTQFNLFD